MQVSVGKSYHIKDEFFELVKDDKPMANKEGGSYRPHFFFFADPKTAGIYWAVPQSSRVEKYRLLINQKIKKYGRCNTIVVGEFGGRDSAFLIQNMFPIIEKYVDHEHTIGGMSVIIHTALSETIISDAHQVLALWQRGYKLVFPDIDKIYAIMQRELILQANGSNDIVGQIDT